MFGSWDGIPVPASQTRKTKTTGLWLECGSESIQSNRHSLRVAETLSTLQSNIRGSEGLCISWDQEIWYLGLSGGVGGGGGDTKAQLCDCLSYPCVLQFPSCLVTSQIAQMKAISFQMLSCMQNSARLFGQQDKNWDTWMWASVFPFVIF